MSSTHPQLTSYSIFAITLIFSARSICTFLSLSNIVIKYTISYSQAPQSHYSFCADSDLGLNTELLYSDDISKLISSQTPLTSTSQISSPITPLSLTRVSLPLQQYWVLYSSKPSNEIEESRKRFIS